MLSARRCVLSLDVEGVLDEKGTVIKELREGTDARILSGQADATGGMAFKLREARRMASSGTEVRFVSGMRQEEFRKALKGLEFRGTTIRVPHSVS
jgi:isopentenyl phosphate kinase